MKSALITILSFFSIFASAQTVQLIPTGSIQWQKIQYALTHADFPKYSVRKDTNHLYVGLNSNSKRFILIYDYMTGELVNQLEYPHSRNVYDSFVKFSHKQPMAIVDDKLVNVYTGEIIQTLPLSYSFENLWFSPYSDRLIEFAHDYDRDFYRIFTINAVDYTDNSRTRLTEVPDAEGDFDRGFMSPYDEFFMVQTRRHNFIADNSFGGRNFYITDFYERRHQMVLQGVSFNSNGGYTYIKNSKEGERHRSIIMGGITKEEKRNRDRRRGSTITHHENEQIGYDVRRYCPLKDPSGKYVLFFEKNMPLGYDPGHIVVLERFGHRRVASIELPYPRLRNCHSAHVLPNGDFLFVGVAAHGGIAVEKFRLENPDN